MNGYGYARLRRIEQQAEGIAARIERENARKAARDAERRAEQAEREAEAEAQEAELERIADLVGGLDPYDIDGGYVDPVAEARRARLRR